MWKFRKFGPEDLKEPWKTIYHSMIKHPDSWKVEAYALRHKSGRSVWISNRPYADISILSVTSQIKADRKSAGVIREAVDLILARDFMEKENEQTEDIL